MRGLVLGLIGRLGRYTVLVFAAFAAAAVILWFSLLSTGWYWTARIGLLVVVVPLCAAAWALLVGMLFAGSRPIKGEFLSRDEASGLWSLWDDAAGSRGGGKRQLRIDDTNGAWIAERRRAAGVVLPEVTLSFGLGLLLALDEPAIRAVVAHEVAHNRLQHTTGATRIGEFERCFETLFERYPPEVSILGWLAHALLGRFGTWLEHEMTRVSRANELAADRGLSGDEAAEATARALVLVHALDVFFEERVAKPLERQLLGAMAPPPSPLSGLERCLPQLREPEVLATCAAKAWDKPSDSSSTHPLLRERLAAALGVTSLPHITAPTRPAAELLLTPETLARLKAKFEQRWTSRALDHLQRQ